MISTIVTFRYFGQNIDPSVGLMMTAIATDARFNVLNGSLSEISFAFILCIKLFNFQVFCYFLHSSVLELYAFVRSQMIWNSSLIKHRL